MNLMQLWMRSRKRIETLIACNRGASAVEYALILAGITLAVVGAISSVADTTVNMWNNVSSEVSKH